MEEREPIRQMSPNESLGLYDLNADVTFEQTGRLVIDSSLGVSAPRREGAIEKASQLPDEDKGKDSK